MRYPVVLAILVAVCLPPALASEPGEPLDCSDWVFLESGLSCSTVIPHPCPLIEPGGQSSPSSTLCNASNDHRAIDNDGHRLWVRRVRHPDDLFCGVVPLWRIELDRIVGSEVESLAYLDERCVDAGASALDHLEVPYPFHPNAIDDYRTDRGGSATRPTYSD